MPSLSGNNNVTVTITTQADTKGVKDTEESLQGLSTKTAAVMGAMVGAAQSFVTYGINFLASSIGDAVKRVDTLDNANRTFENMGFSVNATKDMMTDLNKSILGLPTSLSDAVGGVELLTGATNDIAKSGKLFDAMNDGIIGFGGSSAQVNGAIIQMSQAFSNGKVDAQTWNSLIQNGMGPALNALAKTMGMTTGALKSGLSDGTVSVGQFQDALINLDTKGGGGMASLQKIAHDSTSGIGTGIENAKTAMTRGLADILKAIGTANISEAVSKIGKAFETALKDGAKAIEAIKDFFKFLEQHKKVIAEVAGVITAIFLPALIAFGIEAAINLGIYTAGMVFAGITSLVAGAQMALAWIMALGPIGLIIAAVAIAAVLIIANFDAIKKFIGRAWSDIKQWAQDAWNWIVSIWQGAGEWFHGIFNGITQWAKNTCDDIVEFFKKLPGRITGAIGNIASNVAGDIKGAFHNLHIPGFATGVRNFGGGLAMVGEQGPELVDLPAGSSVYTNQQSQKMMGGSVNITIQNLNLPSVTDRASFIAALDQDTILAGRGMTPNRGIM